MCLDLSDVSADGVMANHLYHSHRREQLLDNRSAAMWTLHDELHGGYLHAWKYGHVMTDGDLVHGGDSVYL